MSSTLQGSENRFLCAEDVVLTALNHLSKIELSNHRPTNTEGLISPRTNQAELLWHDCSRGGFFTDSVSSISPANLPVGRNIRSRWFTKPRSCSEKLTSVSVFFVTREATIATRSLTVLKQRLLWGLCMQINSNQRVALTG